MATPRKRTSAGFTKSPENDPAQEEVVEKLLVETAPEPEPAVVSVPPVPTPPAPPILSMVPVDMPKAKPVLEEQASCKSATKKEVRRRNIPRFTR